MVLYLVDADFVMISDGNTRKLDHLKKKRRKHLTACPYEDFQLIEKYQQGTLKDSDIRSLLFPIANQTGTDVPKTDREG
ncbi:MAG: hypothetical protein IJN44_09165 [Clostridia bacterium]|nr:hypothetical protein [Clostridia bacterium]